MPNNILAQEEALRLLPGEEEMEEGPLYGPPPQSRHHSRELVLKLLYAHEIAGLSWPAIVEVIKSFEPNSNRYAKFALDLIQKVLKGAKKIDKLIVSRSEKWDFSRITIIDKLILRMAIAELLYFIDIPPKVTINEAIEIAKHYSTDNSGRFVNGVLDGIYNDVKDKIKCV